MRLAILAILGTLAFLAACTTSGNQKVYNDNIKAREKTFLDAQALYPQPQPKNFPARQALIKYVNRQDSVDHPFYVYVFGDNGNVIGYYVAQSAPLNSCDFLSSTDKVVNDPGGQNVVVQAPSLDGIYYGGTGAAGACDEWFFFDAATDAMVKIRGFKFFTADQPLRLQADPILVQPKK